MIDILFSPIEKREMSLSGRLTKEERATLTNEEAKTLKEKQRMGTNPRYIAIKGKRFEYLFMNKHMYIYECITQIFI